MLEQMYEALRRLQAMGAEDVPFRSTLNNRSQSLQVSLQVRLYVRWKEERLSLTHALSITELPILRARAHDVECQLIEQLADAMVLELRERLRASQEKGSEG